MTADVEGAVRIARIAMGFDWTWTLADVPRFCDIAEWRYGSTHALGQELVTNLDVRRHEAHVFTDRGWTPDLAEVGHEVQEVAANVADFAHSSDADRTTQVEGAYSILRQKFIGILGAPAYLSEHPYPKTVWEAPNVCIELLWINNVVTVNCVNPLIRKWERDQQDETDDFSGPGSWP